MSASPAKKHVINGVAISRDQLETHEVSADRLIRVFSRAGGELNLTLGSSSSSNRFGDPDVPPVFADTCMANAILAAVAEVRGIRLLADDGELIVRREVHTEAKVARYESDRPLLVLPLTGLNVSRIDAVDIVREADHAACQMIAKQIHSAFPDIDAIEYVSRMYPPALCWSVYDRGLRSANVRVKGVNFLHLEPEYLLALEAGKLLLLPADDPKK